MHVILVVHRNIPLPDVRRNKLRYLIHFSARSKFCDSRSVTLFYFKRACLVSWRTWWSDALTLPYPPTSELLGLESIEDEYRCGNRIILAIVIALKSKDFGSTPSLTGNRIIELSCLCCQISSSYRCFPTPNSVVLQWLEYLLVKFSLHNRDPMELQIYPVFWKLAV